MVLVRAMVVALSLTAVAIESAVQNGPLSVVVGTTVLGNEAYAIPGALDGLLTHVPAGVRGVGAQAEGGAGSRLRAALRSQHRVAPSTDPVGLIHLTEDRAAAAQQHHHAYMEKVRHGIARLFAEFSAGVGCSGCVMRRG